MNLPKTARNQKIVELRQRARPLSFQKIGEKFNISQQRAQQIYAAEMKRLISTTIAQ